MHKNAIRILSAGAALVLALTGCSGGQSGGSSTPQSGGVSAATVWSDTLSTRSYQEWKAAPGYETKQPAKGPHGKSVAIFVNPTAEKTLSGTAVSAWPTGTVIVKDAYDAGDALASVEYMQKTDGGWFYASFEPDGTVSKEGVGVAPCQPCHSRGTDSVISVKLPS